MSINRRDLFKGAGAFLGAASAYKVSEAGVLLPFDKIITESIPPWAGKTMVIAFEGAVSSFSLNAQYDAKLSTTIDGRMFEQPLVMYHNFNMEFIGDGIPIGLSADNIYVQIFKKVDNLPLMKKAVDDRD